MLSDKARKRKLSFQVNMSNKASLPSDIPTPIKWSSPSSNLASLFPYKISDTNNLMAAFPSVFNTIGQWGSTSSLTQTSPWSSKASKMVRTTQHQKAAMMNLSIITPETTPFAFISLLTCQAISSIGICLEAKDLNYVYHTWSPKCPDAKEIMHHLASSRVISNIDTHNGLLVHVPGPWIVKFNTHLGTIQIPHNVLWSQDASGHISNADGLSHYEVALCHRHPWWHSYLQWDGWWAQCQPP